MEKKSKKSIIIGVTALLLVTLTLLGLTYAYYRTRIVGNTAEKSVSVSSKKIEVTYSDGTSSIELDSKVQPGSSFTKSFTVQNTGEGTAYFSVVLDNLTNTFQRDEDWTYTLTKGGSQVSTGTIAVGTHQVLVAADSLASGEATYVLTVTYANPTDIDQSEDMGSTLSFRVNISDEVVTWENADAPSWAEGETTLMSAIKTNGASMIVATPTTKPGQAVTTTAEISSTQDDYGTSYYYRGNVENNYVNYSGMCWRIVRVQGDGSIKLALADENGECNAATYNVNNTTSAFVGGRTDIAYKASAAYDATDFPFANSDIPLVLSTWAENKNLDMSQLVEAEWCNDTAMTSKDEWSNYYGAYNRLYPMSTAEPTLKCNTKGMEGSTGTEAKAIRYRNVLGILSADEVAFAGATNWEGSNWNYYLQTNANGGNFYWTLSPYYTGDVWYVDSGGNLYYYSVDNPFGSVRPAVVLRSDVTIQEGGVGTQTNPYVIK